MARAAGLKPDVCQTIATAAQFVDDNVKETAIEFADGGRLDIIPTAHPWYDFKNIEIFERDQRIVWLPFHFLPGNEGDSISERFVCRKDSIIAQEMIGHCLSLIEKPFGFHLVGIATHVYADTFSHYGFSGVSSRWNKVNGSSIKLTNDDRDEGAERRFRKNHGATMDGHRNWRQLFWDKFKSGFAESSTGALGHSAVMNYPDYPYLEWKFSYEHKEVKPRTSQRNNLVTYLEACEKLHGMFCRIAQDCPDAKIDQGRKFDSIRESVKAILGHQETDRNKRRVGWSEAAENGNLFEKPEPIPPYQGDKWKDDLKRLDGSEDSHVALDEPVFRFFQAAETYRAYVLRDLLPLHGLVAD